MITREFLKNKPFSLFVILFGLTYWLWLFFAPEHNINYGLVLIGAVFLYLAPICLVVKDAKTLLVKILLICMFLLLIPITLFIDVYLLPDLPSSLGSVALAGLIFFPQYIALIYIVLAPLKSTEPLPALE